jgi:hypothetical protein
LDAHIQEKKKMAARLHVGTERGKWFLGGGSTGAANQGG